MRVAPPVLFALALACGGSSSAPAPTTPEPTPVAEAADAPVEPPALRAFLLDAEGLPPDDVEGPLTLIGPSGRCALEAGASLQGCQPGAPAVGFARADVSAVYVEADHDGPPPLSPGEAFHGQFPGTRVVFEIRSPPAEDDPLCPGAPTTITLARRDADAPLATIELAGPLLRALGQGPVAWVETPEGAWVLLAWPGHLRLVDLEGRTVHEVTRPVPEDCDCCDAP